MNQREYTALFADTGISHVERTLYLYLRWHMDYATGRVGEKRRISYQGLREHLEYQPARTSNEASFYPSKPQISRLLRKLESRGLIERIHKGHKESMVFSLVLASADLVRPNEARHKRDTGSPTRSAIQQKPVTTGATKVKRDTERDTCATQEARHTSDTSDIDPSLNARDLDSPTGEQLAWSSQFLQMARITGLSSHHSDRDIENLFDLFRNYNERSYTAKSMTAWLADWRSWVQREKARYEKQHRDHTGHGRTTATRANSVADVLKFSREYASKSASAGSHDW